MIIRRNERNKFIVYGKAQANISGLTLKRRIVDNKTRYYDIDIKISFQDGEYFFDTEKYLFCSSINKEYYLDIVGIESVEAISMPIGGVVRYDEADIVFDVSEKDGKTVLKYGIVPNVHACVTDIKTERDEIIVEFSTDSKDPDPTVLFMRRSFTTRNGLYNKIIELETNGKSFFIPSSDLFKGKSEKGREIWDVAIRCEKIGYIFIDADDINDDYCDKDSLIAYKPFNSDGYLSIWTMEGENKNGNKIKVAILGSCYIKEAFHSLDFTNPDYKRFYDNVLVGFHHSFISLTSSPIDDSYDITSEYQREIELYSEFELKKNYFRKLKDSKANYLLVDNYADATLVVGKDERGQFITKNYYLNDSNLFTDHIKLVKTYTQHGEERIALYEEAVKKFREKINEVIPLSHVILVRGRQSLYKQKEDKSKELWPDHDFYEKSNKVWEKLDNIFLR
ncbi:MAG: hypothetical protein J5781_08645, partial [Clostridia bacterium]|nr:hypothetical protein [Clostridia bacterium]